MNTYSPQFHNQARRNLESVVPALRSREHYRSRLKNAMPIFRSLWRTPSHQRSHALGDAWRCFGFGDGASGCWGQALSLDEEEHHVASEYGRRCGRRTGWCKRRPHCETTDIPIEYYRHMYIQQYFNRHLSAGPETPLAASSTSLVIPISPYATSRSRSTLPIYTKEASE